MAKSVINIESQIKVLEDKLSCFIPNPLTGKYDSKYYALKGKINNLKKELFVKRNKINHFNWLAQ